MRFGDIIRMEEEGAAKHKPHVEIPSPVKVGEKIKLRIHVGKEVVHPNTVEHHIKWIQVFLQEKERLYPVHLATIDLGPSYGEPKVELSLKLRRSCTLLVLSYCNLHGLWENHAEVEVR